MPHSHLPVRALHTAAFAIALCACSDGVDVNRRDATPESASTDARADIVAPDAPLCGDRACRANERCVRAMCIPDNGTCDATTPCQNDTRCVDGVCVPFGMANPDDRDPMCRRTPRPLDRFDPVIQCEWPGSRTIDAPSSTSVRAPPLVADLTGDGVPEIIFPSWGGGSPYVVRIRAIRGDTCEPVWTSSQSHYLDQSLAVADLTGDGRPEVCGRGADGVPYCLRPDGTLLWEGRDAMGARRPVEPAKNDVGISIANVDATGPPEVVVGLNVFDGLTGRFLRGRDAPTRGTWAWSSIIPAIADVDGDGAMEAYTGGWVVDLASGTMTDWGTSHGYTAVAELWARSAGPEIVVVAPDESRIRVHAATGAVIFERAVPGSTGGAPTISDLDGDGQREFATAGNRFFTAFDLDCVTMLAPGPDERRRCPTAGATDGVLWSVATHEFSSGITGSSVFDFEGDGAVEVVYADECWVRVFDGATGRVKFSAPHESGTGVEYPVVADVDGDFYTELVVPHERWDGAMCPTVDPLMMSSTRPAGARYAGITVYRDRDDRWSPSRPLWSQHTEHWSNRRDDGTVPPREMSSWLTHNSYRQALPREGGTATDSPDFTVGGIEAPSCDTDARTQVLRARVCNRGTLPAPAGANVVFHIDSSTGAVACMTSTPTPLAPGACVMVGCTWMGVPLNEARVIHATVGAASGSRVEECHTDNNGAQRRVQCPDIG